MSATTKQHSEIFNGLSVIERSEFDSSVMPSASKTNLKDKMSVRSEDQTKTTDPTVNATKTLDLTS